MDRDRFREYLNPLWLVPRALRRLNENLSHIFANRAYYRQAQMDINVRSRWHEPDFVRATGGYRPSGDATGREVRMLEPWDMVRRDMLILLLRSILERGVEGDLAELGVFRGRTARLFHHYCPERRLFLFDTFRGFDARDVRDELRHVGSGQTTRSFSRTTIERVRAFIEPRNENVEFVPGFFPESVPAGLAEHRFAFVHLDADLYPPTMAALRFFYPRMSPGGFIVTHDYNAWPGARQAVDEFAREIAEIVVPMPDKSGSALITKLAGR